MSAYIVDPRTVDYLVAWTQRHRHDHTSPRTGRVWDDWEDVPQEYRHGVEGNDRYGYRLNLMQLSRDDLGRLLMRANVRSVAHRYDAGPDDLPGPKDQRRVWSYKFRPIQAELQAAWAISCADCLRYQSCEVPDYRESLAWAVTEAIREDAISAVTEDAPWGISEGDLQPVGA